MDYDSPDYPRGGRGHYSNPDLSREIHAVVGVRKWMQQFKQLIGTIRGMNLQEAAVTVSPFLIFLFLPVYLALMYAFPHWNIFLISLVPVDYKVPWVTVAVLCFEMVTATAMILSVFFLFFFTMALQAFYFRQLDSKVRELRFLSSSRGQYDPQLRRIHQWFRAYYVMITLCNVLFSRILFSGKLLALSALIFSTFYVITYAGKGPPVLFCFFALMTVAGIVFWGTATERLFQIPAYMGEVKHHFLHALHTNSRGQMGEEWKAMEMDMKAIENVGIKDGGFRTMESVS